jgi:hypothetical protein
MSNTPPTLLHQILKHKPHNLFEYTQAASEYGSIVRLPIPSRFYIVTDPKLVKELMSTDDQYLSVKGTVSSKRMHKITSSYHAQQWEKGFNNGTNHMIERLNHKTKTPKIDSKLTQPIRQWRYYADNAITIDAVTEAQKTALVLFDGLICNLGLDDASALLATYKKLQKSSGKAIKTDIVLPHLFNLLFHRHKRKIHRSIKRGWQEGHTELADELMQQKRCPYTFIKRLLVYQVEFFGSAFAWCIYLLGQNPEFQHQLYLHYSNHEPVALTDDSTPFLDTFIKETLRLYPPMWTINRRVKKRFRLSNYELPAKSTICISTYGLHRHPYYWKYPNKFYPQRFLERGKIEPYTYLPFGSDVNKCPAKSLVWRQLKLCIIELIQNFAIESSPLYKTSLIGLYSLKPYPHHKINLQSRQVDKN